MIKIFSVSRSYRVRQRITLHAGPIDVASPHVEGDIDTYKVQLLYEAPTMFRERIEPRSFEEHVFDEYENLEISGEELAMAIVADCEEAIGMNYPISCLVRLANATRDTDHFMACSSDNSAMLNQGSGG